MLTSRQRTREGDLFLIASHHGVVSLSKLYRLVSYAESGMDCRSCVPEAVGHAHCTNIAANRPVISTNTKRKTQNLLETDPSTSMLSHPIDKVNPRSNLYIDQQKGNSTLNAYSHQGWKNSSRSPLRRESSLPLLCRISCRADPWET